MADNLREMQKLYLLEAAKYHVFPIDDPTAERFNPASRDDQTCRPGGTACGSYLG
ncbi:MAG: hypothetical protein O6951_10080 [Actinobacteria bacterium]|nr:hypothetical protein [Actinomycetota bacterium]